MWVEITGYHVSGLICTRAFIKALICTQKCQQITKLDF
jgi:hypothetical protein